MEIKDLIVIGGGINGAGIAADAAGRGLSVLLLEAQDLASATSSVSSKLIHGGLRYLEHYEFRLVSEALAEREVLLRLAPHIAFPMRFRLPHRTACRENGLWIVEAEDSDSGKKYRWKAKGLVNATGPWVKHFFDDGLRMPSPYSIRLIKGSHIVVPRVHIQEQAYILQNEDKRIVFVIPWLNEFSIIGTTDVEYNGDPKAVTIDENEIAYLLNVYNAHFKKQLGRNDIVWAYSGVRPLCDDESDSPQTITRDYTLDIYDHHGKAPLLSVFGGKLTIYRKLAEHAMDKLTPWYQGIDKAWTKDGVLPGGDIGQDRHAYTATLRRQYHFLTESLAQRYACTYGSNALLLLGDASSLDALGEAFGHECYEAELRYLVTHEWVRKAEDALWRRTKLGMWMTDEQQARIADWLAQHSYHREPPQTV